MFKHPWGISEDDLTGDFFGLMKYIPTTALFIPFVGLIRNFYPDRNINPKHTKEPEILLWPEYEIPKEWREQFNCPDIPAERRRNKYYIVPDVVINFDDCTFIVEAEKSHSVEPEQLFQQYLISRRVFLAAGNQKRKLFNLLINTDHMPPYSCGITAVDKESGVTISPTDSIPQYIQKRTVMARETCDIEEISRSFIWISWHHISKLAEEVLGVYGSKEDEFSQTISRFLSGFKAMMDREGFYPVRIFRADDPNEVYVDDYSCIQVLKGDLKCDLTEYEGSIEPSFVPAFKVTGYTANWLKQQTIEPETINILTKEGGHG